MARRRSLALIPVLAALAVFALYQYGYLEVKSSLASVKEAQKAKSATYEKYATFVAKRPELEARLARLKEARKADEPKLLSGETLSLAAAALQTSVKGMLTARGGTISSERVEKPEDLGKFKVVTVSIDAVMPDARALSDALYAMETQTPSLFVKELDARVRNFTQPKDLMIRLKVAGLTGGK